MHVRTWKSTLADDKIRRAAAAALYDPSRQRGSKGGAIKVISSTARARALSFFGLASDGYLSVARATTVSRLVNHSRKTAHSDKPH